MLRRMHVVGSTAGVLATFLILLVTPRQVFTDTAEPWVLCTNSRNCASSWTQRDAMGINKWTECWQEPWCRNWLEQILTSVRPGKRDIFMSRGWGAGGMPFSVLYLNSHIKFKQQQQKIRDQLMLQQQQKAKQQEQGSARQPRFSPLEGDNLAARTAALVSEQQEYGGDNTPTSKQPPQRHIPHKQYAVLPQLFISYGWGPLG